MTTAHLQISHADVIVINKSDAVTTQQLNAVEERVRAINGLAKIHVTQYGNIPQLEGLLLDIHAYDGLEALGTAGKGHSHLDPVSLAAILYIARLIIATYRGVELTLQRLYQLSHSHSTPSQYLSWQNSNHGSALFSGSQLCYFHTKHPS